MEVGLKWKTAKTIGRKLSVNMLVKAKATFLTKLHPLQSLLVQTVAYYLILKAICFYDASAA